MPKARLTCQICEREIALMPGNLLAHHGYRRPGTGWQTGSCPGARQLPFELSCDVLRKYVDGLRARVAKLETQIAGEVESLFLQVGEEGSLVRGERRPVHRMVTEATLPAIAAEFPRMGKYNGSQYWTAPTWADLVERWKTERRTDLAHTERELAHQAKRLDGWKLVVIG